MAFESCRFCKKNINVFHIDPFTKRYKLVHNGGFTKIEVLYCSQNNVKSVKIK